MHQGVIAMDGVKSFQQIFVFVILQAAVLLLLGVLAGWFALRAATGQDQMLALETSLIVAAGVLLLLRTVWPVLSGPVETLWGTSPKIRARKWLFPALQFGAIALLASALLFYFSLGGALGAAALLMAFAGIGAPLAVTGALLISAQRRQIAFRKGVTFLESIDHGAAKDDAALERVRASIATEAGRGETTARANTQGFAFAGLTAKPWHDPNDIPWVAAFEAATDEILAEAMAVLGDPDSGVEAYAYAGLDGDFWRSFKFAARHSEIPENLAKCPKTAALLKTIPGYPSFRDAMFSILEPGGVISPHRDVSNVFLTMHLPLIAPGNGYIEVGGLRREWRKGEALIFDSSYNHEACNHSDDTRVVLLVDFLHPDLTAVEREWVREARL